MKNFLLFAGEYYYPFGGGEDFVGAYDTLDAAKRSVPPMYDNQFSWAHVFSLEYQSIVAEYANGEWEDCPTSAGVDDVR